MRLMEPPIETVGTILSRAGERIYRAALPNGKEVIAHVPAAVVEDLGVLEVGATVRLELTPYDFSMARIAARADSR